MTPEWMPLLTKGLAVLGLEDRPGVSPLLKYIAELERWNERLGLVHARASDLIVRHVLDSLAALPTIETRCSGAQTTIADIGSGGGLPGIPLACFLPQSPVFLVERSERKCGFLRGAVLAAGLANAEALSADYTELHRSFDLLVFRAFQPLSGGLMRGLSGILARGGVLYAYKGRRERIDEELDSLGDERGRYRIEVVPVTVPFLEEERNLVVIERAEES